MALVSIPPGRAHLLQQGLKLHLEIWKHPAGAGREQSPAHMHCDQGHVGLHYVKLLFIRWAHEMERTNYFVVKDTPADLIYL